MTFLQRDDQAQGNSYHLVVHRTWVHRSRSLLRLFDRTQRGVPASMSRVPEIISLGPPIGKFIGRTIALGTLNAALLTGVGWSLIGIVLGLKRFLFRSR
jgi:hypothetical protein